MHMGQERVWSGKKNPSGTSISNENADKNLMMFAEIHLKL
jgi:hypothetical protein